MPYKSKAQEAYMHINHPEIAKQWDKEHNTPRDLPKHVKNSNYSMTDIASIFDQTIKIAHNKLKIN